MPLRHFFFASVCRCSDLADEPFEVVKLDRGEWATGDFVAGRVVSERNRVYQCETCSGRMAEVVRGDLVVGALGRRAATLEGVGDWRDVADDLQLEALTSAGLLARATSTSPMLPDLMRLDYQGHVLRNGSKLSMSDFVTPVAKRPLRMPVILLIGTSMSSGKTTAGQIIIRALKYMDVPVVAAKLTGAARYRDILSFRDAGASPVVDFVDAGLPSTVCEEPEFRGRFEHMLSMIAASEARVLVAEAGASPLEPYNGALVVEYLRHLARFTVLCASDPYAVLGVETAYGDGLRADLVAGPAANTTAATRLVRELTNLPALNLLDRKTYPELVELLKTALQL
jgi:hypothetical protein